MLLPKSRGCVADAAPASHTGKERERGKGQGKRVLVVLGEDDDEDGDDDDDDDDDAGGEARGKVRPGQGGSLYTVRPQVLSLG